MRVTLTDNGGGFSPSVLAKAFEPYITTKPTGTGLGLPMVKKIMDEHHARISLGNRTEVNGEVIGAKSHWFSRSTAVKTPMQRIITPLKTIKTQTLRIKTCLRSKRCVTLWNRRPEI